MLAILQAMLENGLQTHSGASSQSCRSVDADAWCKRVLKPVILAPMCCYTAMKHRHRNIVTMCHLPHYVRAEFASENYVD